MSLMGPLKKQVKTVVMHEKSPQLGAISHCIIPLALWNTVDIVPILQKGKWRL